MTKQEKVEKNIRYAREQAERFLKYEYKIKYPIEVSGHKRIEKEGLYSRLLVKDGKPYGIDISYDLLVKGNREKLLFATLREAVKVALWYKRLPYGEGTAEYENELKKYGLPSYGGLPHTGKDLHTYGCSECKKIYFLKEKMLPKSKDVTLQNVFTKCCKARFEYVGKIHYTNKQLQAVARLKG